MIGPTLPLSADEVLELWDAGHRLEPVDRTRAILQVAMADRSPDRIDGLTLGEQQALLLRVLAGTFGDRIDVVVTCDVCGEVLELALDLPSLMIEPPPETAREADLEVDGHSLRIRTLTGADLRAATRAGDPEGTRRVLGERAIVHARRGMETVAPGAIPDDVLTAVGEALETMDPGAELLLDLTCPGCGGRLDAVVEAGSLLWTEVSGLARRLLREVHALASAYGWSETEILRMSGRRRSAYLSLLSA